MQRLTKSFQKATGEKIRCQEEVNHTNATIELANRLVKGLEVSIFLAVNSLIVPTFLRSFDVLLIKLSMNGELADK